MMNQEGGEGSSTFSGTGYKLGIFSNCIFFFSIFTFYILSGITPDDTIVVPDAAKMLNKRPDPVRLDSVILNHRHYL